MGSRIEEAQLSLIIEAEVTLVNLLQTIDFTGKLGLEQVEEVAIEEVQEVINGKKERLRKLRQKEDEFNRNAALVPESDPDVALINDKIGQIKEDVERSS